MVELRSSSDIIIDTSELNIHQLATTIQEKFASEDAAGVQITVMSFGLKYGLPADADSVADARFLPNPFWNTELRSSTGLDENVSSFVLAQEGAAEFVKAYASALEPVLAGYQRENKRHATVAIGCTGGKHRSVAIAVELAALLRGLPGVAELARIEVSKTTLRAAELATILRFSGGLQVISGRISVESELESVTIARRVRKDLAELYGARSEATVVPASGARRTANYLVRVVEGGETLARQT
eukprot:gene49412-60486_t